MLGKKNMIVMVPVGMAVVRFMVEIFYMLCQPQLNFERTFKIGLTTLYTFFLVSIGLTQWISSLQGKNDETTILYFFLLSVILIFSFCSAFVQFTLIKLVYILPD